MTFPTLPRGQDGCPRLLALLAGAFTATAALLTTLPAVAASPAAGRQTAIESRYQAERKACLDGRTGQDQATCLKEAGAARAEALRQRLDNGEDSTTRRANALERCAVQPVAERRQCEMLAQGQGMESGSVRDGGVVKEIVTRSVGSPAAAPASQPMPVR